jgi:AbrB family looped-hinge helix DNA binding protein
METTLSSKGQIILPAELRKKGRFLAGDKFKVREKNGSIILQPVRKLRNAGLLKLLRSCPCELVIPGRDKTDFGRKAPAFE